MHTKVSSHFFTVSDLDKSTWREGDQARQSPLHQAEPLNNHGWEWRCYMRDPDGYLIEVGQYTEVALDWFNNRG
ncbi:MAG: hypothetical protein WCC04_02050 [Terriglobales bacterium]